jgi:hypothetical protein
MASDVAAALLRAHLKNIERYQTLLSTPITALETRYLERRLYEEQRAVEMLQESNSQSFQEHSPLFA